MLNKIHKFIFDKFLFCVFLAFALAVACIAITKCAKFNQSVSDILPLKDEIISEHEYALSKFDASNRLYFLVSSSNLESLEKAVESLKKEFETLPYFKSENTNSSNGNIQDLKTILNCAPLLLNENDFAEIEENSKLQNLELKLKNAKKEMLLQGVSIDFNLMQLDPLSILKILQKKLPQKPQDFGIKQDKNRFSTLLFASFDLDAKDSQKSTLLIEKVELILKDFLAKNSDVNISYAGAYRISSDNAKIAKADSKKCLFLSIILMILICILAFKRKTFTIFALLPSSFSAIIAFAICSLVFESVASIAIAFASIAMGVSLDYALHIIFLSARKNCKNIADFSSATCELARPIFIASCTTLCAFIVVYFSGSSGFRQLGVFGGAGIVFSAIFSVIFLAPILAKLPFKESKKSILEKLSIRILFCIKKHSKFAIVSACILCFVSILAVKNLQFDGKISSFSGLEKSTQDDSNLIRSSCSKTLSKTSFITLSDSLDNALKLNEELCKKLSTKPYSSDIISIKDIFPTSEQKAKNLGIWKKYFSQDKLNVIEKNLQKACENSGVKFEIFKDALTSLKNPKTENALENLQKSPTFAPLFDTIKFDESSKKYAILTLASISADTPFAKIAIRKELGCDSKNFIMADNELFENRICELAKIWILKFLIFTPLLMFVFLSISFKSIRNATLMIIPTILGLLFTFATMAIFGIKVSLINTIFVIFAVCIAQDYAVFFMSEHLNKNSRNTLSSVLASALTTIAGFGALSIANHPVLKGLGQSAAISIFSILLSTILFLPLLKKYAKKETSQNQNRKWTGKSHGGYFGHLCFAFLVKHFGLKPAYVLLVFVSIYFILFKKGSYKESARFLKKCKNPSPFKMPFLVFKHTYTFGTVLIDKWAYFSGYGNIKLINTCKAEIENLLKNDKGLVAISAHFGGWEMSATMLKQDFPNQVKILGLQNEHSEIKNLLDKSRKVENVEFLGSPLDKMSSLDAFFFLKKGGILAIQGDRYAGGKFAEVEFLGELAKFPTNAFTLAEKSQTSAIQTLCLRVAPQTYEVRLLNIFTFSTGELKDEAKMTETIKKFAHSLEEQASKYPEQWFNFYDFWARD